MDANPPDPATERELRRLSEEYAAALDTADRARFLAVFTEDAVLQRVGEGDAPPRRGHAALGEIVTTLVQRYAATFHLLGQSSYDARGDRADGVVYCQARHLLRPAAAAASDLTMNIRYLDRYRRDEGRWAIERREVHLLWRDVHPVAPVAGGLDIGDGVRNTLGRYCELIDAGRFDELGMLFAPDGAICAEDGHEIARGPSAVAAFYRRHTMLHGERPATKHLVVDTVVDAPDERGWTSATSSYVVLQAAPGLPLQPIIAGRYADLLRPGDAGDWRFVRRIFAVDLVGDLSRHLGDAIRGEVDP